MLNKDRVIKPTGHLQMKLFKGKYDYETDTINGEILNEFDDHNVIVNMASNIMTSRIMSSALYDKQVTESNSGKNNDGYEYSGSNLTTYTEGIGGIKYLALGNGLLETFTNTAEQGDYIMTADTLKQIAEQETFTQLQHEIYRQPIDYWSFLGTDGEAQATVSNQIRFTTLIPYENIKGKYFDEHPGVPPYIVEMGLFCADGMKKTEYDETTGEQKKPGSMFNYRLFKGWSMIENSELLIHWTITF